MNTTSSSSPFEIKENYVDDKLNSSNLSSNSMENSFTNRNRTSSNPNSLNDNSYRQSLNQNTQNNSNSMDNSFNNRNRAISNPLNPNNNSSENSFNNPFSNSNSNNNSNNNINFNRKSSNEIKSEIKNILINDIKEQISHNIFRMTKQEIDMNNYLNKMKTYLTNKNLSYKEAINDKQKIFGDFKDEQEEIDLEVKVLKEDLNDSNKINMENCFNFVQKDEKFDDVTKYLCYEATIEDTFPIIKRGFTKGAISFDDSIREIRRLSRDLFKLKIYKEKMIEKYE